MAGIYTTMTEQVWRESTNPQKMMDWLIAQPCTFVSEAARDRKLRLFACAVVRLFFSQITLAMQRVVEVSELMADGLASDNDFYIASREEQEGDDSSVDVKYRVLIHKCATNLSWDGPFLANGTIEYALYLRRDRAAAIANILREFCNPFQPPRPVVWRHCITPQVTAMVDWAYDNRDFAALPIIADAMEEAGCDQEDILWHLRGHVPCDDITHKKGGGVYWCPMCGGTEEGSEGWMEAPVGHSRGCWAADAIQGRS